jgi:hypothetical protein
MFRFVVINYLSQGMVVYLQNYSTQPTMWFLWKFLRTINAFLRDLVHRRYRWKNVYDVYTRIVAIFTIWPKVFMRYTNRGMYYRLSNAIKMMQHFVEAMPQCIDYIGQGLWVFFNVQWRRCLFFQSCMMMALVVTRAISDSVFRTLFLHRIWYCS